MIYTEEMKRQINSFGLEVIEFKWLVKWCTNNLLSAIDRFIELCKEFIQIIQKAVNFIVEYFGNIKRVFTAKPIQRIIHVYRLNPQLNCKYGMNIVRKKQHRARSCCA